MSNAKNRTPLAGPMRFRIASVIDDLLRMMWFGCVKGCGRSGA
jgi:hypothetical protein